MENSSNSEDINSLKEDIRDKLHTAWALPVWVICCLFPHKIRETIEKWRIEKTD